MPAIITDYFRLTNADTFKRLVGTELPDQLFFAIGRWTDWNVDSQPPVPDDSDKETIYDRWDRLLAAVAISEPDVTFCAPRYDWTTGTVYDQYDHTDDQLSSKQFYVRSSDDHVYKVIDNNNDAQSTVEPSSTSLDEFTTADGYTWKYMYTIDQAAKDKFLTPNFMPVFVDSGVKQDAENKTDVPYTEPPTGHGHNPIEELRAFYLCISRQIGEGSEPDLFIDNDYRDINLWLNPLTGDGLSIANNPYYAMTHDATVSNISGSFLPDEVLVDQDAGTTTQGTVIQWNATDSILRYKLNDPSIDFAVSVTVEGSESGATATIDSIATPDIQRYSGRFILAEHRPQISRAENQSETLITILEF